MPSAVPETSAVTATAFASGFQPDPPRAIIPEQPEGTSKAPQQPACDSEARCHETRTELASGDRVAFLAQLSASIGEINQPISAVVMNAEAVLRLLLAQPEDAEAIRRLLACIVKDGMRTGDIANRTRTLIKDAARRECLDGAVASLTDVDAN
jgi:C4-dicarboxylate-specific signal transduction histidine kinase